MLLSAWDNLFYLFPPPYLISRSAHEWVNCFPEIIPISKIILSYDLQYLSYGIC